MSNTDTFLSVNPVLKQRLARQWSQAELALRAGISRAVVKRHRERTPVAFRDRLSTARSA